MPGPRNLVTDVPGLSVGHAHDARLASGVTVCLIDGPNAASGVVVGGAPGGRQTALLSPETINTGLDAVVLSGGSTFGLGAADGVQAWLREAGRGALFGGVRVPLAAQAICFDLVNGGDKDWGRYPPYRELGHAAAAGAAADFALGTVGGGYGATTADLKGGLGSASTVSSAGHVVGALVVVNAVASAVVGGGPHFWAGPYEEGDEFGGLGPCPTADAATRRLAWKGGPGTDDVAPATTIALVATDAVLDKAQCRHLAGAASGGLHRGLRFAGGITDGDTVFAVSTRRRPMTEPLRDLTEIGALAGDCLARAIARGVHAATALPFPGAKPAWRDRFQNRSAR